MAHFSFNKPDGACPTCTGLGVVHQANTTRLVDEQKSILDGAVYGWNTFQIAYNSPILQAAAAHYGFTFDVSLPVKDYAPPQRDLLLFGVESSRFRRHFPTIQPPTTVRQGRFEGIATSLLRRYTEHLHGHVNEADYRDKLEDFLVTQTCPNCAGTRLRPESRVVTVNGQTIIALTRLPLGDLGAWLGDLPAVLSPDEQLIAEPVLVELSASIARLVEVGAGYLTLERASPSLSAGETQRLRLASLLGSGLSGVLYVFDEPSTGLHPLDVATLVGVFDRLLDAGATIIVIDHDLDLLAAADHLIDMGPGGGPDGGHILAAGTPADVARTPGSATGPWLAEHLGPLAGADR